MDLSTSNVRLSRIDTMWTVVCGANRDDGQVSAARRGLFERYGGAVQRYLLAATRDRDAADDLFQEFAVRFLRGGLRGADPDRGRFRDFLKGVLSHLVADYFKKGRKHVVSLGSDHPEPAAPITDDADQAFRESWRDELLARSWAALAAAEKESGQPHFTVLRYRADNPDASSAAMADGLSRQLGKMVTAAGVRQTLHRARERFADLLLDEIAQGLDRPTPEALEEELVDLGLLEHCRPALERRRGGS
jgi:RNA polymerase sigma-70 factor (ECF subfamily)